MDGGNYIEVRLIVAENCRLQRVSVNGPAQREITNLQPVRPVVLRPLPHGSYTCSITVSYTDYQPRHPELRLAFRYRTRD